MDNIVQQPGAVTSQAQFENIPGAEVERSTFDRSHGWKSTLPSAGFVYPCYVDEYLPGDTFKLKATAFVRLATPLKPIMDRLHIDLHFFSVANRLLYEDFPNLMGERKDLADTPDNYSIPQVTVDLTATDPLRLADFLGLPMGQATSVDVSALPFRAYRLIWSEWYRDQNLQEPLTITSSGNVNVAKRNKRKDYFTSALPWAQKGDPVILPIGVQAPVGLADKTTFLNQPNTGVAVGAEYTSPDGTKYVYQDGGGLLDVFATTGVATNRVYADLANATATTINDLRTAFQIQKLLERDARSGTRYVEVTLAHFGVLSDDRRQFRPEYLGGGSAVMQTNPVANTTGTVDAPQGELSAVSTGVAMASFTKSFVEHGTLMGMISIRSDLTYQNGIEKMWLRQTRYDFYWPVFAHLGEQAIANKELWVDGTSADDDVFGYAERWSEYRYKPSRICGQFRSNHASSLDVWHLAQDFAARPTLGDDFRRENPPVSRIIAVPAEPHFLADVWFDLQCTRPMPVYGVPGLVDHF